VRDLLLLSGGLDSTALAAWKRPAGCLFIDYGQRPAEGEARSAIAVAKALDLPLKRIVADCSIVGAGALSGRPPPNLAPTPEWWPFRNQLLVTLGSAYAVTHGFDTVLIGTVMSDGSRHADGKATFVDCLSRLLALQEGSIHLVAPALDLTTAELIRRSDLTDAILGWTHSCHLANRACGGCPGCRQRAHVLAQIDRLN
jgi:7-cyano-7-deazaguanine synthase